MVGTLQKTITADEFFEVSSQYDRAELMQGEVVELTPAGGEHGLIASELNTALGHYVKARKLGRVCAAETGFVIMRNPDTVRAPDVAFISNERMGDVKRPKKFWPFAPDLAVEVVSPGDTAEGIEQKVQDWFDGGTREVWVVYPTPRTVHVYHSPTDVHILRESDALSGGNLLPGFSCPLVDIFA